MKLHIWYDATGKAPPGHSFSAANVNDVELAAQVPL